MLAARLDRANGGEIIPGIVFAFAEKSVGGFPFRLDAVLVGRHVHRSPARRRNRLAHRAAGHPHADLPATISTFSKSPGCSPSRCPAEPGQPSARHCMSRPRIARASAILRERPARALRSRSAGRRSQGRARTAPIRSARFSRRPRAAPSAGAARQHDRRRAQGRERDDRRRLQARARRARSPLADLRGKAHASRVVRAARTRAAAACRCARTLAPERRHARGRAARARLGGRQDRSAWARSASTSTHRLEGELTGASMRARCVGRVDRRTIEPACGTNARIPISLQLPQRRHRSGLELRTWRFPRGERPKFGAAVSWPASMIERRIARVRVNRLNSASPSPQRTARCKRGQILVEAPQHLQHRFAVVQEDVAPHGRIGGGDAGEIAKAAGGIFDHFALRHRLEIGRGAHDVVGDQMRHVAGDGQHQIVVLRRP